MNRATTIPASVLLAAATVAAQAQTAPVLAGLSVHPAEVRLDHGNDLQRIVVLGTTTRGATVDLTAGAVITLESPQLVEVVDREDARMLRGRADGSTVLVVQAGGASARVPVVVSGAAVRPPVSFANDVIPILTHAGCNSGGCHGAASGKNGFALSLFGYDPGKDHVAVARELRGRRIDPARPDLSLLLQKGAGLVPHTGGRKLAADGEGYAALRTWIAAEAPSDLTTAPTLRGIRVLPPEAVLVGSGTRVSLQVLASYSDGSDRDVTELAIWSSGNDGSVAVDGLGRATSGAEGSAAVLARFGSFAAASQVLVLGADREFRWPDVGEDNLVDREVHRQLRRARIAPADLCTDDVFLRRVTLDLLGTLPTVEQTRAFLADEDPAKRPRLVDALLDRPEFALKQAMAWAEVLQVDPERMEPKGAANLSRWLQEQFLAHRPMDEVVRELLLAQGSTFDTPQASFWLSADQPHLHAEVVAQVFMGVRMQCAQCHNHPFENWTMDDYYGFAAFFGQLGRKRGEDPVEWLVWDRRNGDVRNKRDNAVSAPRFPAAGPATVPADTDRRQVFADWLLAQQNPWFATNLANRVWAQLMGRGIVDPVDDVRISNPASHPDLLRGLAATLVEHEFDLRVLFRLVCNSRTYQLAMHDGSPPAALFAGNQVRRLPAETMLDAIGAVTGVPTKYPGVPAGATAAAIASGKTDVRFLSLFGRPDRASACSCERRPEPTLSQTLHLINGATITAKVADANGRLRKALAAKAEPAAMLEELFLAAYCRRPTQAEQERVLALLAPPAKPLDVWQDVYWAVLNSKEFLFQH
ncbi:MAG: hypothetical protein RL148_1664 [Planctomycetota bacterium]